MERYAASADVLLAPRAGRAHEGLPVWAFGRVSIVMDAVRGLIRAQVGEAWVPVSLGQLAELNGARAKAAAVAGGR